MRAALKNKLGHALRARRRELAASFKRSQETNRRSDDGPLDLADTASELYTQEFNLSLSEKEREELRLITDALDRLEMDDYGGCEECGEKITEARLKAIPWALLCIDCQEKKETVAAIRSD